MDDDFTAHYNFDDFDDGDRDGDDDSDAESWTREREDFSVSDHFRLHPIDLQSPAALAARDVAQECQSRWGIEIDPDDTLIATLYIEDPKLYPAPHRANVAHSMTLTEALLRNWQQKAMVTGLITSGICSPIMRTVSIVRSWMKNYRPMTASLMRRCTGNPIRSTTIRRRNCA